MSILSILFSLDLGCHINGDWGNMTRLRVRGEHVEGTCRDRGDKKSYETREIDTHESVGVR